MASGGMTRVLLMDYHPVTRRGLERTIDQLEGFAVVAQAADGEEAVRMAETSRPDVIIMDAQLPCKEGIEASREILDRRADPRVLVYSALTDGAVVLQSTAAGAMDFISRNTDLDTLNDALRQFAVGYSRWFEPVI